MSTTFLQSISRHVLGIALACVVALCAGCGGGPSDQFDRTDVSGTVTLDGQPVQFGDISFRGAATEGGQSAHAAMEIRDGRFESDAGARPGAGSNEVSVTVYSGDPNATATSESAYTTLGMWTGNVEVGSNPIDITIKKSELKPN